MLEFDLQWEYLVERHGQCQEASWKNITVAAQFVALRAILLHTSLCRHAYCSLSFYTQCQRPFSLLTLNKMIPRVIREIISPSIELHVRIRVLYRRQQVMSVKMTVSFDPNPVNPGRSLVFGKANCEFPSSKILALVSSMSTLRVWAWAENEWKLTHVSTHT